MDYKSIIFKFIVPIGALIVGFDLGYVINQKTVSTPTIDSFYTFQSASVDGKITAVLGNNITVTNKQGVTATLELGKGFAVSKVRDLVPVVSSNPKDIETGKDVRVILGKQDNKFKVTTITYAPPALPNQPTNLKNTSTLPKIVPPEIATASGRPLPAKP